VQRPIRGQAMKNELGGFSRSQIRSLLKWGGRIFLLSGIGLLLWFAGVIVQTHIFQVRAEKYLASISKANESFRGTLHLPLTHTDFLGRIDIPRIGLSAVIVEGSDDRSLRLGVGHISGTALPGEPGNVALAGHRDTFFRPLRKIHPNDEIRLTTFTGTSTYRVDWAKVVGPDDTEVLKAGNYPTLTLVTCYPFYFVGSAPKRFIVRAHCLSDATLVRKEDNRELQGFAGIPIH
jgi:sortase A